MKFAMLLESELGGEPYFVGGNLCYDAVPK